MQKFSIYLFVLGIIMFQGICHDAYGQSKKIMHPRVSKIAGDNLTLGSDFNGFKEGPMFMPMFMFMAQLFGYQSMQQLFYDFFQSLIENSSYSAGIEVVEGGSCDGQSETEAEGIIKIIFNCEKDHLIYSCYANLVGGNYSITIPEEVNGLVCAITVEAAELEDEQTDLDITGVESEEIEVSDDTSIVIDITE